MKSSLSTKLPLSDVLSIISIVIAIASAIFAAQSANEAHEANIIARDANDLLEEANKIAYLQLSPDISVIARNIYGAIPVIGYGCRYPSGHPQADEYFLYSMADGDLLIINDGEKPAYFTKMLLSDKDFANRDWEVTRLLKDNVEVEFPAEISANSVHEWHFSAVAPYSSKSEVEITKMYNQWYPETSKPAPRLSATLFVNDYTNVSWDGPFLPASPGLDFNRDCTTMDQRSAK